ncbi:MAG: Uma2 family endonuclease [Gemmataceae bacterium]|nr:Uma2 family endonuclease [Gemmataceae bacterium]
MASIPKVPPQAAGPELHNGDRMTREEFHRIYEQMPEDFKAELIGGIVYVASPLKRPHGITHPPLTTLLYLYKARTPGVEAADNATVLLGDEEEPQPDLFLRILPEFGGQSRTTSDDYVAGPPELIIEIAHSSRAVDLHAKRRDYTRNGVLEYLVACLRERQLRWFDLRGDRELEVDSDGVVRTRVFPGLWIHGEALFTDDSDRLLATLNEGLAAPEHAAFVQKLAAARQP